MSKRTGSPVHIKGWYKHEKPLRRISLFFQNIKFARQRVKYGWCDRDTWNIDTWFLNVITPMLEHFKEHTHSYPSCMASEEWDKILDQMIFLFKQTLRDPYDDDRLNKLFEKDRDKWFEEVDKFERYQTKCRDRGLDMFKKWFGDLWD